eukprot:TRINITY_DN13371_c0_g1_i1.p1 TRINITY_DN13371_c0_g1~~TRINITY_DN13371_c0_g1_i1.p1  ORF type:complete len:400 (+),score=85.39 TRINITY_DN13371_c0_g1_i1:31-1200(+)
MADERISVSGYTMNAAFVEKFGSNDVIQYDRLPRPVLENADDVLVSVYASCVNPVDWKIRDGITKLIYSYKFPLILGIDFSGVVLQVGSEVTQFKPGDEVFGKISAARLGAYAEVCLARHTELALKPKSVSHAEAASLPTVALTSYQAFHLHSTVSSGSKVLVYGGSTGTGSIAVQIAHALGAHVTVAAGAANHSWLKSLGADVCYDYKTTKIGDVVRDMDVVYHTTDADTLPSLFNCVKKGGCVLSIAAAMASGDAMRQMGAGGAFVAFATLANTANKFRAWRHGCTYTYFFTDSNTKDLSAVAALVDAGTITPVVSKLYHLSHLGDAFRDSEAGRTRGKIVVVVRSDAVSGAATQLPPLPDIPADTPSIRTLVTPLTPTEAIVASDA